MFPGEDAFRFRHLLIRDAAYDALPKSTRAELHERFAEWIGERGADLVELDEIIGYHLERAYRYRVELGPAGEGALKLASRAADRLAVAGTKAAARGDMRAATSLLARAADLYPAEDVRRLALDAGPRAGAARSRSVGSSGGGSRRRWHAAQRGRGRAPIGGRCGVALTHLRLFTDPSATHEQNQERACRAGRRLRRARGSRRPRPRTRTCRPASLLGGRLARRDRRSRTVGGSTRATPVTGCRRARASPTSLIASLHGPTPVATALERAEQMRGRVEGDRRLDATILRCLAHLEAMRGNFDTARLNALQALGSRRRSSA